MADDKDAGKDEEESGLEIIKRTGHEAWEKAKGGKENDR